MSRRRNPEAKKQILQVCVKLFLEQGYKKTTMVEIIEKSGVCSKSFQSIFRAKDGVLTELAQFMFSFQFGAARRAAASLPPVCVYAAETAIQLTLTELNENLREIYVEAYSQQEALEYILRQTAKELYGIFGPFLPELNEEDFYMLDIGSAGLMRAYMARPCDAELPLEKKLRSFLSLSLRGYHVPQEQVEQALAFVAGLDIRDIAGRVMQELFRTLAMRYEFSPQGLLKEAENQ